jgi:hypothetical protein
MASAFMDWLGKQGLAEQIEGETIYALTEDEVERLASAFNAGIVYGIRNTP